MLDYHNDDYVGQDGIAKADGKEYGIFCLRG